MSTHTYSMLMKSLPCLVLFLALHGAYANTHSVTTASQDQPVATHRLSIQYDQGWINAQILDTPMGEVCRELEQKTGVRFVLSDPHIATWRVSATLEGLPLQEGIKKILSRFSYAIYPAGETGALEVKVLSAPEAREWKDRGREEWRVIENQRGDPVFQSAGMPQSYEESHSVEMEFDREAEIDTREHEHQEEALLQHVLDAPNPEDRQLPTETLTLLQGMDDPRATELLIEAALGSKKGSQAQVQAVEILWHHAATLGYQDEASVSALKQLADGNDSQTVQIARHALQSMEQ